MRALLMPLLLVVGAPNANAQSNVSRIALRAVEAAVDSCAAQGHKVTAVVVNTDGQLVAAWRGPGATPHTLDSARQKAFTAVSLGPIVNMDRTSEIASRILASPASAQLANVPNLLLLGGGIALRESGQVVGAIGVGGAPGGHLDEACAAAGLIAKAN